MFEPCGLSETYLTQGFPNLGKAAGGKNARPIVIIIINKPGGLDHHQEWGTYQTCWRSESLRPWTFGGNSGKKLSKLNELGPTDPKL